MTGTALSLLAEARRVGITLRADGDRLRYKPVEKMPPDLARRLTAHKPDILAVLRTLDPDNPTADRTDCPQTSAARPDDSKDAPIRPARFAGPRQNRPTAPADDPVDAGLPVRWQLDATDRAVLLECGIMPTPNVADLPPVWQQDYARMVKLMIGRGVHLERAEHIALMTTLRKMLATGDLPTMEGW